MPFNDGIPRINCFSLGDFHDFDRCPFKFFVFHHLEKKYELSETERSAALGSLLDQAIKHFHKCRMYGAPASELEKPVRMAASFIRGKVAKNPDRPSFYSGMNPYLDENLVLEATQIFQDYYLAVGNKIYTSVYDKDFCEIVLEGGSKKYKLWGGPDTYELAEDGVVEVVDYKYRSDLGKGKTYMDMDLMPKIYMLLSANDLKNRGYDKARFVVRFWQDPTDTSFYEEFSLDDVNNYQDFFRQKIEKILNVTEVDYCKSPYCQVCTRSDRGDFLKELEDKGFIRMTGEEFLNSDSSLPF